MKNKFVPIAFLISVVIVAVGLSLFRNYQSKSWKIYTDTKLHYSIEYPNDWKIGKVCEGGVVGDNYICLESPDLVFDPVSITTGTLITIAGSGSSMFVDGILSPDNFCQKQEGYQIQSCTQITINGLKAIKRVSSPYVDVAVVNNNKIIFIIRLFSVGGFQSVPAIFDQILSTFQFTK